MIAINSRELVVSKDHNDSHSQMDSWSSPQGPVSTPVLNRGMLPSASETLAVKSQSLGSEISSSRSGSPGTELPIEFRVVRSGSPVRRLRLTGNRYTFGSGDGCSVQLDDETLRPMHAVLLRDVQRVLMRAYSIPLEHNGTRVTEATLRVGDIIRMGNYRFELLSAPGIATADARVASLTTPGSPNTAEAHLKHRLTDLSQQWHLRHAECEARESRCDQRESDLHLRESELWGRADNLQRRERLLVEQEDAARAIQETYDATQEEIKDLRTREADALRSLEQKEAILSQRNEELRARNEELRTRKAEWETREKEFAEHAAEASRQLEQTQQQAVSATEAVQRMREEFASLNEQLNELRERHAELQEREKKTLEEHTRLRAQLERERDAAIDARAESEAKRSASQTECAAAEAKCAATQSELTRVEEELSQTRRELEQLRKESRVHQTELNEKLTASSHDLQEARQKAEEARSAAVLAQADAEQARIEAAKAKAEAQQWENDAQQKSDEVQKAFEKARCDAEGRVNELTEKLEAERLEHQELRTTVDKEIQQLQSRLNETRVQLSQAEEERDAVEGNAVELRQHVASLQESLTESNAENSKLRVDVEGANASIRQLELLVDQTKNNQALQHDSWSKEAEQLRVNVEELSTQLAQANAELSQLREANEALSKELEQTRQEFDSAAGTTVKEEQWQQVQDELTAAQSQIETLQVSHQEALDRLESEGRENEATLQSEILRLQEEIQSHRQTLMDHDASVQADASDSESAPESWTSESVSQDHAVSGNSPEDTPHDDDDQSGFDVAQQVGLALAAGAALGFESTPESDSSSPETMSSETPTETASSTEEESPKEHPDDHDSVSHGENLVESGDSVWRMEGEKPSAMNRPTVDWADADHHVNSDADDWNQPESGSHESPESHSDGDVNWTDEPPEQAIGDAIEDIEYNVEQAIAEYDQAPTAQDPFTAETILRNEELPADEIANEMEGYGDVEQDDDANEIDAPPASMKTQVDEIESTMQFSQEHDSLPSPTDEKLDWSAYMPGGDIEQEPDQPDSLDSDNQEAEAFSETSPQQGGSEEVDGYDMTHQWAGSVGPDSASDVDEENSFATPTFSEGYQDQPFNEGQFTEQQYTEQAFPETDETDSPEQNSTLHVPDELSSEDVQDSPTEADASISQSTGVLAEMLIRDLTESAAVNPEDYRDHDADAEDPSQQVVLDESETTLEADQEESDWSYEASGYDSAQSPADELDELASSESEFEETYQSQPVAPEPTASQESDPEPEDDSIEAYMNRLLQRVQGGGQATASPPVLPPAPAPESAGDENDEAIASQSNATDHAIDQDSFSDPSSSSAAETEPEPERDDTPLVPRSQAPERERNMSAMRDLANQSARNAVARSIRIQARDTQMKAGFKGIFALTWIAMAAGVYLFVSWSSTIKLMMMGAFVVLGVVFAYEGWTLWRDAHRRLTLAEESSNGTKDDQAIAEEMARIAEESDT